MAVRDRRKAAQAAVQRRHRHVWLERASMSGQDATAARVESLIEVCIRAGLHCIRAAIKRKDAHDAGLLTSEQFERLSVGVGRTAGSVEHVHVVCHNEVPNAMGELLATSAEWVSSMMERMARSATPLSWWTCGGQVVFC
eukprot:5877318-Pleurochrysis_carterae.AAC.1